MPAPYILPNALAGVLSLGKSPFASHIEHMQKKGDFPVGANLGRSGIAIAGDVGWRDRVDGRAIERPPELFELCQVLVCVRLPFSG